MEEAHVDQLATRWTPPPRGRIVESDEQEVTHIVSRTLGCARAGGLSVLPSSQPAESQFAGIQSLNQGCRKVNVERR